MDLPNTHIIGVQKAATTSIFHWLSQHSEVFAPLAAKDYPVFSDDRRWNEGVEEYSKLFKGYSGQKIILAGSVHTFRFTYALERLYSLFPESKLILVLRDPVERLLSAYNYRVKCGAENLSFQDALKQESKRLNSPIFEEMTGGGYIENGYYYKYLTGLYNIFPRRQIKILWYEDVQHDPDGVMRSLFQFLSIDKDQSITFDKKNVTGQVRWRWLFDVCFSENRIRKIIVDRILRHITTIESRTRVRHWLKEINTSKKSISTPVGFDKAALRNVFHDDIELLEKLLDRDLSDWKI